MISGLRSNCLWCLLLLTFWTCAGCYQQPVIIQEVSVDIPGQFTADGAVWQVREMGAEEEATLSLFFMQHPELMDSPEFEGRPSVFASEDNLHRFYWLHASAIGPEWRCVEVNGRASSVIEGTGNPFG